MIKEVLAVAEKAYKFEAVQNPSFQVEGQVVVCRSNVQHSSKRAKVIRNRISTLLSAAGLDAGLAIQEGHLNNGRQYSIHLTCLA
jgi:hypothetical protein